MKSMVSIDDLRLFLQVVAHGGINAAAAETGQAAATLSRRLRSLEQALGCRLLERSAHQFALTEMGHHYFSRCSPLVNELESVTQELDRDQHRLEGKLRVTAPVSMSQRWLGRCFFDFAQRYPQISMELVLSNQYENLVEQQFDAAFRVGQPREGSWIARHIWTTHMGLCASAEYLSRVPTITHPDDLQHKQLVVAEPISEWDLRREGTGELYSLAPISCFRTNDINLALDAVASGLGISLVPNYYFSNPQLAPANLISVLPEWQGRQRPVYLLYRDRAVMSARLRVFIDFVIEWMARYAAGS